MNFFCIQHLLTAVFCIAMGVYVYAKNASCEINKLFTRLYSTCAVFLFFLAGFVCAPSHEDTLVWHRMCCLWALCVSLNAHFVLAYTRLINLTKHKWILPLLHYSALIITVISFILPSSIGMPEKKPYGWVLNPDIDNPITMLFLGWFIVCHLLIWYLVVRYYFVSFDSVSRKKAQILLGALFVPSLFQVADNIAMLLTDRTFPPLITIAIALSCVFMTVAVHKFNMLVLTPVTAAQSIVSTMSDAFFLIGRKGRIQTANRAACKLLNYKKKDLLGKSVSQLFKGGIVNLAWLKNALDNPKNSKQTISDVETTLWTQNKTEIPVSLSGTLVREQVDYVQGVLLIARDISARKRNEKEKSELEAKFLQAQKIEAIGRLAGGVAHDINNVLSAIMASASVIKSNEVEPSFHSEDIKTILSACSRGKDLTRNLLGFARKGKYVNEIICLNELTNEAAAILERTAFKKIVIVKKLCENLNLVSGDRSQLQSALINISINAVDAMDDKGQITFETDNCVLDDYLHTASGILQPGKYIRLQVSDTGCGMNYDTVQKAFEPFFTTKPEGKGTGLGLSMVYGVITNHGGAVTLKSVFQKGTTIGLYVPVATDEQLQKKSELPSKIPLTELPKQLTVLIVDDETLVLNASKRLLKKMGFIVKIAQSGRQALEIFKADHEKISFVLLDMMMPEMNGKETFLGLRAIDPSANVILFSGYNQDEDANQLLSQGAVGYIQKPFDHKTLKQNLSEILAQIENRSKLAINS